MRNLFLTSDASGDSSRTTLLQRRDYISELVLLLQQSDGDEILINGGRSCQIVGSGTAIDCRSPFESDLELLEFVRDMAWSSGLRLDAMHPMAGGALNNGRGRWHAVIAPLSHDAAVFSLRRHRFDRLALSDVVTDPVLRNGIAEQVRDKVSILIAGSTNSGKTTCLSRVLQEYFASSRVVILESIAELGISSPQWIRFLEMLPQPSGLGGFSLHRIAAETLRLRPDVLVVGELRGAESEVFLDMSVTGHGSCFATIHASTPREAVNRLIRLSGNVGASFQGSGHKVGVLFMEREKGIPRAKELEVFAL